ncbi:hypothetical protein ABN034_25040 [Actinopolymorpha sp. B11F2]|uniref:hypothetical protein n=1 Tax=Actinopolymorpha sp. B11F2 TaxID=3160862 RepID=UPI0032E51401
MLTEPERAAGTTRWRLVDRRAEKVVELVESGGDVAVTYAWTGDAQPIFAGTLGDMLTVSTGRPWRFHHPGVSRPDVRGDRDALVVSGAVGDLDVRMAWRFDGDLLRVDVTWRNSEDATLADVAAGLVLELAGRTGERITIPGVVYNDNPSADPARDVPRIGRTPGGGFVCEEHRLPIPAVNVEWVGRDGLRYLSVHVLPSYVEDAEGRVHYGSLGVRRTPAGASIVALSGVVMFGGQPDIAYVHKGATSPYDGGYLDFQSGFTLRKRYAFDWGSVERRGHGFRRLVKRSLPLHRPGGSRPHSLERLIQLKTQAMDARWTEHRDQAGYLKFPAWGEPARSGRVSRDFLYGWTGQCLRLAWCDGRIGIDDGVPERITRCRRAVDCYVGGSATTVPGLRLNTCLIDEDRWQGFVRGGHEIVSSRAYGETLCDLADIVQLFRSASEEVPEAWTAALRAAAEFVVKATLTSGIAPLGWRLDGSPHSSLICAAGLPVVSALVRTALVTGDERRLRHAESMMERYHQLHAETFDRPFAHSTLDAACEDKEGGMSYFLAAYDLWLATGRDIHRERAALAADWLLTFVYVWSPAYDRGSLLRERGFSAVGWPTVSVQNHHLDVFFPTYELWQFGHMTDERRYVEAAETTMYATGQGICTKAGEWDFGVVGEQGEAFFQTNWQRRGWSNTWNPSWVIALPLSNALRMRAAEGSLSRRGSQVEQG